jgi:hypothetical protein
MVKRLIAGAVALVAVAVVVPVLALPSVDMTVDVMSVALVGPCATDGGSDPMQTWNVELAVVVNNTSEDVVTFERTGYSVEVQSAAGRQTAAASVVDPGGFTAGEQVGAATTRTFTPTVATTIPCDATAADMFANLKLVDRDKEYVDGAPFLADGTPVPLGPTGAIGIAIVAGAMLLLAQRLGRRPKTLDSHVGVR